MKRHGGDLEGDRRKRQHHADLQHQRGFFPYARGGKNRGEIDRSHAAVEQRATEQQQGGGERSQDEVFQSRLAATQIVALERRADVEREALQLQADIEREQRLRRNHKTHAERGKQHDDDILEAVETLGNSVVANKNLSDRQHAGGRQQNENLAEQRESIETKMSVDQLRHRRCRCRCC